MDLSHQNRPGGVSPPINPFEPRSDTSKNDEPKSDAGVSSTYAINSRGETTDLRETLALRPHVAGSTGVGEGKSLNGDREGRGGNDEKSEQDQSPAGEGGSSGDKPTSDEQVTETGTDNDSTKSGPKVMKEYSAEARTYHAYYDELQRAHLSSHYTWCRDHCLQLLAEPRIPVWTRIQTLQLPSTMLQPTGAEQCLFEAEYIIGKLSPNAFQTQLLREDNRKMKADRMAERNKKDMVGEGVQGVGENGGEGPSEEEDVELDRELNEKLRP